MGSFAMSEFSIADWDITLIYSFMTKVIEQTGLGPDSVL
jgi:hypothetical protein